MDVIKLIKKPDYVKLEHSNPQHNEWFVVNWCLGNTCNYECSYCPPNLHNGGIPWPDLDRVKNFIKRVVDQVSPRKVYFELTGGEVTMYRHFEEVCKYCTELGAKVGIISNGSRTLRWWEENKHLFDHVCLSFHPEHANADHFVNVVKILNNDVRTHVNIMMSPEKFDHCYAVANRIKNLGNISMALQPLIHDFGDTLFDYTPSQKNIFDKQHELITKHIKWTKSYDYYRGAMRKVYESGETEVSSAHRFISEGTNDWSGWKCYSGVEQIIVDLGGRIYRGWCKLGEQIGNVDDENLQLPHDPIICSKTMCHCNFDIMSTKVK
jgi:MoaA/NifB/PqqE/SkfB family radical SAM enzyme